MLEVKMFLLRVSCCLLFAGDGCLQQNKCRRHGYTLGLEVADRLQLRDKLMEKTRVTIGNVFRGVASSDGMASSWNFLLKGSLFAGDGRLQQALPLK